MCIGSEKLLFSNERKAIGMKKYRIVSMVALLCALAVFVSGCGVILINEPSKTEPETTAKPETTAPEEPERVPEDIPVVEKDYTNEMDRFMKDLSTTNDQNKYSGAVARIVGTKKSLLVPAEDCPKIIKEDLVERNEGIESSLGITVVFDERDPDTLFQEAKAAVRSGTYYADAIMYPQYMTGAFVKEGVVLNMNALPDFETDMGYFYPSSVSASRGGDGLYAVAGPASLNIDALPCIFFNKDMVKAAGLESPYALVDRGEWTIDKYLEYTAAATALEGDYYAYGAQHTSAMLTDLFFFGMGETLTQSLPGQYPTLTLGSPKTADVINKVRAAIVDTKSSGNALTAIDSFKSGNTMFLIDRLDNFRQFSTIGVDWGILPMPKYSAEQTRYYTLVNYEEVLVFSALSTAPDYEMTADLIACINIVTYGYTKDAYVKDATYFYLRDNESIRMMETVIESPVFDFAYSFSGTYDAIPSMTYMAIRNVVSEVSTLDRYLGMYAAGFEQAMYWLFDIQE